MATKLPKKVYVYFDPYDMEQGEDEPELLAERTIEGCADLKETRLVGVYELVGVEGVSAQVITK